LQKVLNLKLITYENGNLTGGVGSNGLTSASQQELAS
jgi:hypothetical protein